jgi:hypothetical protein
MSREYSLEEEVKHVHLHALALEDVLAAFCIPKVM